MGCASVHDTITGLRQPECLIQQTFLRVLESWVVNDQDARFSIQGWSCFSVGIGLLHPSPISSSLSLSLISSQVDNIILLFCFLLSSETVFLCSFGTTSCRAGWP